MMLGRIDGIILLGLFVLFQFYIYRQIKDYTPDETIQKPSGPLYKMIVFIILGLAGLVIGGRLVLDNTVLIAKALGVSEKVIGLTIIAAGTSLPELATSVVAAFRKNADIAVGNIVGSNIFNLLLIGGTVSFVSPVKYSPIFDIDFYILAAGTIVLFINLIAWRKHRLDRWEAALLLSFYVGYTIFLISRQG
jgi:cation:H+ antiporter